MKLEFERYGLPHQRRLTGGLQLLGSAGLFLGLTMSPLLTLTALAGLGILMSLGVVVRLRIRDPWTAIIPAFTYALLCAYLFLKTLESL